MSPQRLHITTEGPLITTDWPYIATKVTSYHHMTSQCAGWLWWSPAGAGRLVVPVAGGGGGVGRLLQVWGRGARHLHQSRLLQTVDCGQLEVTMTMWKIYISSGLTASNKFFNKLFLYLLDNSLTSVILNIYLNDCITFFLVSSSYDCCCGYCFVAHSTWSQLGKVLQEGSPSPA